MTLHKRAFGLTTSFWTSRPDVKSNASTPSAMLIASVDAGGSCVCGGGNCAGSGARISGWDVLVEEDRVAMLCAML